MNSPHPESAVAIIGMACRLPGSRNIDEFWTLVRDARTAWGPAPKSRFDRELYFHPDKGTLNKSYSDLAAVVDYPPIDRTTCPISDAAIAAYDIAHLTLCEVAASACRHAGFDPAALAYDNTGVYVGHAAASGLGAELTYGSYIAQTAKYLREAVGFEQLGEGLGGEVIDEMIDSVRRLNTQDPINEGPFFGASCAARLIADTFALTGPCMSFNAACASSSRALAQAMRSLQLGTIDMALVGGASFFHSDTLVLFSQSQALSASGSRPFSAEADGMVAGEGYVVLVLKMLEQAVADKDRVLAVLPGIGVSSDGHGKSLWAPRQQGQVKAIQRAYGPQVSMSDLQYIEAHATSTSLGDVTEIKALTAALAGQLPPGKKVPAGSAKLNVGHTLESAGLVGVLKTVLALQHELIPPAIRDAELNPEIDWVEAPISVSREAIAWPRSSNGTPRRAGVNAFGIGGLNVHVVVDEFLPSRRPLAPVAGSPLKTATTTKPAKSARRTGDEGIAIIGMGAVMPGALSRDAFWELLASGRDPKIDVPASRWDADAFHRPGAHSQWETPTKLGGFVTGFEYDWRKHKIPPKQIQQASPLQFMILDAVDQAIQQSGYHERPFNRPEVGVVVGTIFGGDYSSQLVMGLRLPAFKKALAEQLRRRGVADALIDTLCRSYGEVLLKKMPALLDETGSFTASALASRITKSFDLMGGAVAIDAGQGSSLAALSCCIDQLRSGDCEMMICVGGQNDMTPSLYVDLSTAGRLANGPVRSPFDLRAQGAVPGEGCGALLLKRLSDARRDKDPIFGIIRGMGGSYDRSPADAARWAISRACQDAGREPKHVSLIEASPCGQLETDAEELHGIAEAYCDRGGAPPLVMGTIVGQIGDTMGASGMAALLKAVHEVETVKTSVAVELNQPAAHVTQHFGTVRVPTAPVPIPVINQDGRLLAGVHSGGRREATYHVILERGTTLKPTHRSSQPAGGTESTQPTSNSSGGRIIEFDATARRRERKRNQAVVTKPASQSPPATTAHANGENGSARPTAPVARSGVKPAAPMRSVAASAPSPAPASARTATAKPASAMPSRPLPQASPVAARPTPSPSPSEKSNGTPAPSAPRAAAPKTSPVAPPVPQASVDSAVRSAPPASESSRLDPRELETFLVNFVVEQTGYPAEIVELDADLEADLGIDSIKKAQLFGELGEYFEVQASDDLSLDDFPTLRHVLTYLVKSQGAANSAPASDRLAPKTNGEGPAPPVEMPQVASTRLDADELEKFLVNFVVEQTGYPAEIVELDADLEADLGIDSIKKAQLFGELGEYFEVQASDDLSLDDFPTLRHVLTYLMKSQGVTPEPVSPVQNAVAPRTTAAPAAFKSNGAPVQAVEAADNGSPRLDADELEKFLVNFVIEQTGYPAEIVELDADLEADLGIDSIKKAQLFGELGEYFEVHASDDLSLDDFPTLRHVLTYLMKSQGAAAHSETVSGTMSVPAPGPSNGQSHGDSSSAGESSSRLDARELEQFLVNFVVEQTGYPAEIVELDADLEADLGIDSIKKAQLFGELGEYFEVQASDDLSLDDFPTLRHVLQYLLNSQATDTAVGH